MRKLSVRTALPLALLAASACSTDDGSSPLEERLVFASSTVELDASLTGVVVVRNTGQAALGPVAVVGRSVTRDGAEVPGAEIVAAPGEIATLNPGDSAIVGLAVAGAEQLQAGAYAAQIDAVVGTRLYDSTAVSFSIAPTAGAVTSVTVSGPEGLARGDVGRFSAEVIDTAGQVIDLPVTWSVLPVDGGYVSAEGHAVGYQTGTLGVVATVGEAADTFAVSVSARPAASVSFTQLGHGAVVDRYTSDLWVNGGAAYTGTWGNRGEPGDMLYAWQVGGDSDPVLTDSVRVDAFTVNDVKIRADGKLAVMTHEYPSNQALGVTLLDTTDPLHPKPVGDYVAPSGTNWVGVHNTWLDGDYLYLVVDGTVSNRGLWILDVSDPSQPALVGQYWGGDAANCAGSCFLHDVYVRDGLAFLSHWDAGLVILDVGNGVRGGSPQNPAVVGRVHTTSGQTHNAWYWPEAGYVFVGEEDFNSTAPGRLHVVDVRDLTKPVEVATYSVPGDTPHNFWLDEDRGILYAAWYTQGVQAIDVNGELLGSLDRQGRRLGGLVYQSSGTCPGGSGQCTWAPQLVGDRLFVSDLNSGLWVFRPVL